MEIDFDGTANSQPKGVTLGQAPLGKSKNEDLEAINRQHEGLISEILVQEEQLISQHRQHIDEVVDLTKKVDHPSPVTF